MTADMFTLGPCSYTAYNMEQRLKKILYDGKSGKLLKYFRKIVGELERGGKGGSYIAMFRKALNSGCAFNDIDAGLDKG